MNNHWNQFIYRLWSPAYDLMLRMPLFSRGRKQAWDWAKVQPDESVLLVGIGTGADLAFLPQESRISGIDLSESMLKRARKKAKQQGRDVDFRIGSAEQLPWPEETFDVVACLLILSVVADPQQAIQEAARVLKAEGRVVIFDKFLVSDQPPGLLRKVANQITKFFGTNINRYFDRLISESNLSIIEQRPVRGSRSYQVIGLRKSIAPSHIH